MTKPRASDSEWLQWIEVQKAATRAWIGSGDLSGAIAILDRFLTSDPPLDLRRDAIAFRGSLHQEEKDLRAATLDYLNALAIAEEQGLEHYSLETSLAEVCAQSGDRQGAERWCWAALKTAAADPRESGAGALLRLLGLRGKQGLRPEERPLVEKVVRQSWHLLRVEGQPDLEDLGATARKLIEAQKGPFSAERPPIPRAF